ncbi:MAG UNVERIFIED_CONTAM: hypothetical protein LVR29_29265 [Microcystis novacekii LVE1205-3]|jgi:phycocyanobilin lyase alpha subunit
MLPWWLGRFRVRQPEAISALIAALEDESDRTPDGGYPRDVTLPAL